MAISAPYTITRMAEEVISQLHQAQKELHELQTLHAPGSKTWSALEALDDRLHAALNVLGN